MQIDAIDLFHLAVPRSRSEAKAGGGSDSIETVVVRMRSDGLSGWGEAPIGAAPIERPEWAGGAMAILARWLAPALVAAQVESGDDLQARLAPFAGHACAKGALDAAWWDLHARCQGAPLHQLLGGGRFAVRLGVTLAPMSSIDELLEAILRAYESGYARITLKLTPAWNYDILRAVRQVYPDQPVRVDFDGCATAAQRDLLYRLDDFFLEAIEQPLAADDLVGHAMLQEQIRTPICLDQSITSLTAAEQAIDLGACRTMALRPDAAGGLTPALAIAAACHAAGVTCHVTINESTAIGARAALALATRNEFEDIAELNPVDGDPHGQLTLPSLERGANGAAQIALPDHLGIGIDPDEPTIARYTLHRETIQ